MQKITSENERFALDENQEEKTKTKKRKAGRSPHQGGGGDFLYIFTKNYAETLIYKGIEL